jgi:hypothetical protein
MTDLVDKASRLKEDHEEAEERGLMHSPEIA